LLENETVFRGNDNGDKGTRRIVVNRGKNGKTRSVELQKPRAMHGETREGKGDFGAPPWDGAGNLVAGAETGITISANKLGPCEVGGIGGQGRNV